MGVRRMRHDVVGLFGRGRVEHAGKHRQRPQRALLRTGEQVKLPRAEAVEKAKAFVESDRQKPVICEK